MKKNKIFSVMLLLAASAFSFTSCEESDGQSIEELTGIPADSEATAAPLVLPEEKNTSIPNISAPTREGSSDVAVFSLTGIRTPNNDWMKLYGTNSAGQNIWMEIDGVPKSIDIVNPEDLSNDASKAMADVVFLVDNSGSMSEEADSVASKIIYWSGILSQAMDVKFGCVGIDHRYVNGALNITDVDSLHAYLTRAYHTGTSRTVGFGGNDADALYSSANQYSNAGGECGGIMLRFADENFAWREGSNRIYVYFTDEPNQTNYENNYSVESVNPESDIYNWNAIKGTIHTVYSGGSYSYSGQKEKPWLFSEYTGGTVLYATSDFRGFTLESLPVTGAITNSCQVRFHITQDLSSGTHTITITIVSDDGTVKAYKEFTGVEFNF